MKSSVNSKVKSTTSPKSRKHAGKEKGEKRRAENNTGSSSGGGKMEPSQLLAFLMGTSTTKQYARLSRETMLNYAEQSICEHVPHEISHSLAEDLNYKLRHLIHAAQVKANLSGRTALMGSDIEATFSNFMLDNVYGASNNINFIPIADNHLYLDDRLISLVEMAEEPVTIIQPGNAVLATQCYPEATANMKNYVRYFDTMCRALICNTPKLQHEALRDIRRNARIGPIVNWFYHFGYFLLSKDITYVSLTLSALDLIRALEDNPIAKQIVAEKELKLLLRLILQRLLRTHTKYEVMQPMCAVLSTLCTRAPLRELVLSKIAQRRNETKPDALPLVCIINALGFDALQGYTDHLLQLYSLVYYAKRDKINKAHLDLLTEVLLKSYWILCRNKATVAEHQAFYHWFDHKLLPFWKLPNSGCQIVRCEANWQNIKAQLQRTRRKIAVNIKVKTPQPRTQVFEIHDRKSYLNSKIDKICERQASIQATRPKQKFVVIGQWRTYHGRQPVVKTCLDLSLDYPLMIL